MVHVWWCSPTFCACSLVILEHVSKAMEWMRWTNSMAWLSPWLKSFRFLSMGKSKVYCLLYRSQWHTGFATLNTELIFDDLCETRIF
jgi:hypothetical protein